MVTNLNLFKLVLNNLPTFLAKIKQISYTPICYVSIGFIIDNKIKH